MNSIPLRGLRRRKNTRVVDLACGSATGVAVLEEIEPRLVRYVVPADADTRRVAEARGFSLRESPTSGDVLFSVHWPNVLPTSLLARYVLPINMHPGFLPNYRGMYPVFWAMLEDGPLGVTIHRMVKEVDAGPIIWRREVPYSPGISGGDGWELVKRAETLMATHLIRELAGGLEPKEYAVDGPVGKNRRLSEFTDLRDKPDLGQMSTYERVRLVRLLTHPEHNLPEWARKVMADHAEQPGEA